MKKISKFCVMSFVLIGLLLFAGSVRAESNWTVGSSTAVRLNFAIDIPTILYLRVGDIGATINTITFDVDNIANTGAIAGSSPVTVRAAGFVGQNAAMSLEANSSSGLTGAASGVTIPFTQITMSGSDDFTGLPAEFNGGASQAIKSFTDSGDRTGEFSFAYKNENWYPDDDYAGQVTYTLSSP